MATYPEWEEDSRIIGISNGYISRLKIDSRFVYLRWRKAYDALFEYLSFSQLGLLGKMRSFIMKEKHVCLGMQDFN